VLRSEELGNGPEQLTNILQKTVVVGAIEQIAVALGIDRDSTLIQEVKRDTTRKFGPLPIWGPAFGA
jgi:hypothetical protein